MNTVDSKEIQNFSKDSAQWWDADGPFAPLHRLNPVRLSYIKQQICTHFGRDMNDLKALKGLSVLDIGCGGGLVCEPMARLGANITGIDADATGIDAAKSHADLMGLKIDYRMASTDTLKKQKTSFDIVLALEIIEHVTDIDAFVNDALALCKPGGLVIFSTLNRTPKSFALGVIAAEYILGWVPKGTHSWKKFVKPSELSRAVRVHGGGVMDMCGMTFQPAKGIFRLSPGDLDVNYFMTVKKI